MVTPDVQTETGRGVVCDESEDLAIAPHSVDRRLMTCTELLDRCRRYARLPPRSPLDLASLRPYLVRIVDGAFRVQIFKDFIEEGGDVPLLKL